MIVKDVMTKSVITVSPDTSVKKASMVMKKNDIGSLIIMKGEKLAGIITERDVIRKVVSPGKSTTKTNISNIMSENVITIDAKSSLDKACKIMKKEHIKKLPVLDKGKLAGIVTETDIVSNEPRMASYIYRMVLKEEKKSMKPILLTNGLLVFLMMCVLVVFIKGLNPLLTNPEISRNMTLMIYAFVVLIISLSTTAGILIFKIFSKRKF